MSRATQGPLRGVVVTAARQLGSDARAARGRIDLHDPNRDFFLGVEAAAEELVHPELQAARPDDWPDATPPAFRDGYLRATAALAAVTTAEVPPIRLRMPQPD